MGFGFGKAVGDDGITERRAEEVDSSKLYSRKQRGKAGSDETGRGEQTPRAGNAIPL